MVTLVPPPAWPGLLVPADSPALRLPVARAELVPTVPPHPPPPDAKASGSWLSASQVSLLLPAIAGALLAAFVNRKAGTLTIFASLLAGTGTSYWCTDWLVELLELSEKARGPMGFFLGLSGMWIVMNVVANPMGFYCRVLGVLNAFKPKGKTDEPV